MKPTSTPLNTHAAILVAVMQRCCSHRQTSQGGLGSSALMTPPAMQLRACQHALRLPQLSGAASG